MPTGTGAEALGFLKSLSIALGPFLAIVTAVLGSMWKTQDKRIKQNEANLSSLRDELYKEYASKVYLETYVALTNKPLIDAIDRLVESNKTLAAELRDHRDKR